MRVSELDNTIADAYDALPSQDKRMLARATTVADIDDCPAFYKLASQLRQYSLRCLRRVCLILPHVQSGGKDIGDMSEADISAIAKTKSPNDLLLLKRACRKVGGVSRSVITRVYYWGDENRRRLVRDWYFSRTEKS